MPKTHNYWICLVSEIFEQVLKKVWKYLFSALLIEGTVLIIFPCYGYVVKTSRSLTF